MKIMISPAKKMNVDTDTLPFDALPRFLPEAKELLGVLRGMDYAALKKLWGCNDALATLNYERLWQMDPERSLTPAILAYEGIQYRYMAPGVFEAEQFSYIREHLRILSGFYGLLRPFDGVTPYRLEMQAKLSVGGRRDLYAFWDGKLAHALAAETDLVLNLASQEYSRAVAAHLPERVRFLTCTFGEQKDGTVIEKGTACKMARGEMVRYLAERGITDPEEIKGFDRLGYAYSGEYSDSSRLVFLKKSASA
ncbi:MAG: peroxide stress protein YaaA [Clostridia bacterium]|nr:peroxide stress protein YaaA [Clostridia bacterium]